MILVVVYTTTVTIGQAKHDATRAANEVLVVAELPPWELTHVSLPLQ